MKTRHNGLEAPGGGVSARAWRGRMLSILLCGCIVLLQFGCEVDSYFDPSRTGRFVHTPTTIPILERIDVIEEDIRPWGETSEVLPQDLLPSDLTYVLSPGDFLTVEIFEGFAAGEWRAFSRRIDAAGYFRLPDLGDLRAAGLTTQEFEDLVRARMRQFIVEPHINVVLEQGTALTFTLDGFLPSPGMYQIRRADFRLSEAMAMSGGLLPTAQKVFVIRRVPLTEEIKPVYDRDRLPERNGDVPPPAAPGPRRPPIDIEDLIEELEDAPRLQGPSPAIMRPDGGVPIDVDDLEPVRLPRRAEVDVEQTMDPRDPDRPPKPRETFIYVEERGEWVRTTTQPQIRTDTQLEPPPVGEEPPLLIERIIEIPADKLRQGVGQYDIVVRPKDRIVVEGPQLGVVYISGEINRPGVYNLPREGGRLTLSRLVAAAGDLGGLAIPERVDLIRKVGPNREATVRLNLAAIRKRTEPDLYLKPDDHIIIGTSWVALPLAVIRNGFRSTYGFGFLLDRNFGNDVFGAPPVNRLGQ